MKKFLFYILVFFSISVFAQFEERFTDGGFNVNPHWDTLGSTFKVVNQQLNFQGVYNSGKASIATADNVGPSAQWEIYVRLGFQPTDTDHVKIVLGADILDLRGDFNGYFFKIGQNGINDGLDFYRKDGANETLIKSMLTSQFASGADANFRVKKNNLGKWTFYWKNNGQSGYTAIDSVRETTYNTSSYFGMFCNYTAASKDSFWFDDVSSVRLPLVSTDTIPPNVVNAVLVNSHSIDVYFDEILDIVSAQTITNYSLTSLNNPTSAVLDAANKKLVHLYYSTRFASTASYILTTDFVKDSVGNIMAGQQQNLITTPYFAIAGDVIINEIMVKPPTTGLPNKQYVELRNTTNQQIKLTDWTLNNSILRDGYLQPLGYVILCSAADTNSFKTYGNTIGVSNWTALNNIGFAAIRADDNLFIDSLPYTDATYQDAIKQLGGWSLELDSQRYSGNCPRDLFWSASNSSTGGTPGSLNSKGFNVRFINATDSLLNSTSIEINFNAPMDITEVENAANYTIDNGITIQSVTALNGYASKAKVTFASALQSNTIYTLIIRQFSACIGFIHAADTFKIAITQIPEEGELIINEVLFNPTAGVEQFIELYNKTNKLFKVKDLIIAQADAVSGLENQILNLQSVEGFILPNDYLLLSKNKSTIKAQYTTTVLSNCTDVNLPAFDTKEDIIVLKNSENETIDKLHYYEDWHFPLLSSKQGVSLERTSFSAPTQNKRNWHSAAKDAGLATPGFLNSEDSYSFEGNVQIIPEIFSPDGDGIDDVATITYSFDEPGSVVNVYLYNADGRLANYLAKEITIPKEGYFTWNGDDEDGNKKDVGIYFLVFERKLPDGEKIIYKRRCVLAAKLN